MPTIEMVPKHSLSFGEFVRLSEQQRKSLGRIAIVPPQLGSRGFGGVITEKPLFIQLSPKASKASRAVRKRRVKKRPRR
jgi:hypothetical protein